MANALICEWCGHFFDSSDKRAYIPRPESGHEPYCPLCCQLRLHGAEMWAVWNDCQGVFTDDVYATKAGAEGALDAGYLAAGCKVVPVRVYVEPDDHNEWWHREVAEREREAFRTPTPASSE